MHRARGAGSRGPLTARDDAGWGLASPTGRQSGLLGNVDQLLPDGPLVLSRAEGLGRWV